MLDLLAIGDIKLDTFVFLDEAKKQCSLRKEDGCWLCLEYGAKLTLNKFETQIAGSAPNVAVALSRLGLSTGVVSIMGDDSTAALANKVLSKEKVNVRHVREVRGAKSSFSIVILHSGERTMLTSHSPHEYRLTACPPTKWIYLSEMGEGYEQLYRDVIRHAKKSGIKIGFNPGTLQVRAGVSKLRALLERTEVLFVNKEEGHALLGERNHKDIDRLIRTLWKLGPECIVLTDGRNGAYAFDGGEIHFVPMFPGKRIEATGAGDSFAASFIGARMLGKGLQEGLRWGAVNSASVVGTIGPQPGLLRKAEILKRLRLHPEFRVNTL